MDKQGESSKLVSQVLEEVGGVSASALKERSYEPVSEGGTLNSCTAGGPSFGVEEYITSEYMESGSQYKSYQNKRA